MISARTFLKLLQMGTGCRDISKRSAATRELLVLPIALLIAAALTFPANSGIVDEGGSVAAHGSATSAGGSAVSAGGSGTSTGGLATSAGGVDTKTGGSLVPNGGSDASAAGFATSGGGVATSAVESTVSASESGISAAGSATGATAKFNGGLAASTGVVDKSARESATVGGGTGSAAGSVTASLGGSITTAGGFTMSAGGSAAATTTKTAASGPKPANLTTCPSLRIGIINGVLYHYEVLAGLMHIFRPYARRTDIYINRYTRSASGDGAWDILRRSRVNYVLLTRTILSSIAREKPFYDLLILVSPDYELDANQELLRHIRRRLTVAIVHNSDFNETQRLITVAESGGSAARLLTLSPHTAATLAEATGRSVDWALAVYPFKPNTNCLDASPVDLLGMCLSGFAIQGKFSNQRRNYSAIWNQMMARQQDLTTGYAARLFRINVLGKGQEERLGVPQELEPFVALYRRLPFRGFYDHLHHSFSIVPVLADARYLTHKFSSSILSSLISGTPLIASRRFLQSYSMLDEHSVYLQADGESEVDAMLRLVATSADELLATRRQMLEARRRMNERAGEYFAGLLTELCSMAASSGGDG